MKKLLASLIAAVSMMTAASAFDVGGYDVNASWSANYQYRYNYKNAVLIPPARYIHAVNAPVQVIIAHSQQQIASLCMNTGELDACTLQYQRHATASPFSPVVAVRYVIVLPDVGTEVNLEHGRSMELPFQFMVTPDLQMALLVHEIGHVNGWPENHPAF